MSPNQKLLLLCSNGKAFIDNISKFIKPDDIRMGYIITASKGVDNIDYMRRHQKDLDELGINYEEIDIGGMNEDSIYNCLENKNIIYVEGGNSFYLLKHIKLSGFDTVVKELMKRGVIYSGSSAGAYVSGPTIETATWKHQDMNRYGLEDLTAMNLVPFLITAHYTEEYKEIITSKLKDLKYPLKILKDGQAIIGIDNKYSLVGEGEEIILN